MNRRRSYSPNARRRRLNEDLRAVMMLRELVRRMPGELSDGLKPGCLRNLETVAAAADKLLERLQNDLRIERMLDVDPYPSLYPCLN